MAMTTPFSTPSPIGPQSAISAKTNSMRLIRQICRSASTSISESPRPRGWRRARGSARSAGPRRGRRGGDQRRRGTRPASWCARPPTHVDRRARIRGGHREGAEQAGRDIGRAEADELAVGVHLIAAAGAEAARGHDAGAEADQEHRARPRAAARRSGTPAWAGNASRGRPLGNSPTTAIPRPSKSSSAESSTESTTTITGPGTARRSGPPPAAWRTSRARARAMASGSPGLADELDDGRDKAVGLDLHAGEPADLADEDRERDAREEAGQDRPRQEGREHPEAQRARPEAEHADDERQHRRRRHAAARRPAGTTSRAPPRAPSSSPRRARRSAAATDRRARRRPAARCWRRARSPAAGRRSPGRRWRSAARRRRSPARRRRRAEPAADSRGGSAAPANDVPRRPDPRPTATAQRPPDSRGR